MPTSSGQEAELRADAVPLPPGWMPMHEALPWMNSHKVNFILLHVPSNTWTKMPEVSVGYWTGGHWRVLAGFEADARVEPVDPDAWMPMPSFTRDVNEANAVRQQTQDQAAAPDLLLAWLLTKHAAETISLRDILRLGPSRLRETRTAARAVTGLVAGGYLQTTGGNARSWTATTLLKAKRIEHAVSTIRTRSPKAARSIAARGCPHTPIADRR